MAFKIGMYLMNKILKIINSFQQNNKRENYHKNNQN